MSDPTISSLGRAAVELTGSLNSPKQEKKPVAPPSQPVKTNQAASAYAQTRLQFQVDAKTNDVIILIRDKQSDKIVRTIPAEAIKDIPPGQILQKSG
ncbi:MAG: flagellar protein FlaG [Leptolinea sp.]|nr:flagellar protein FlaG [Leptolinea sp.]